MAVPVCEGKTFNPARIVIMNTLQKQRKNASARSLYSIFFSVQALKRRRVGKGQRMPGRTDRLLPSSRESSRLLSKASPV